MCERLTDGHPSRTRPSVPHRFALGRHEPGRTRARDRSRSRYFISQSREMDVHAADFGVVAPYGDRIPGGVDELAFHGVRRRSPRSQLGPGPPARGRGPAWLHRAGRPARRPMRCEARRAARARSALRGGMPPAAVPWCVVSESGTSGSAGATGAPPPAATRPAILSMETESAREIMFLCMRPGPSSRRIGPGLDG